jgi:hypothetical protein
MAHDHRGVYRMGWEAHSHWGLNGWRNGSLRVVTREKGHPFRSHRRRDSDCDSLLNYVTSANRKSLSGRMFVAESK